MNDVHLHREMLQAATEKLTAKLSEVENDLALERTDAVLAQAQRTNTHHRILDKLRSDNDADDLLSYDDQGLATRFDNHHSHSSSTAYSEHYILTKKIAFLTMAYGTQKEEIDDLNTSDGSYNSEDYRSPDDFYEPVQ